MVIMTAITLAYLYLHICLPTSVKFNSIESFCSIIECVKSLLSIIV